MDKISNIFKGDKVIWMVFFFLCVISIVEVFSASSTLSYKTSNYFGPIAYHVFMILIGFFIGIVTLNIPCRYFKLVTPVLLLISFFTLLWVLFGGESINGANRVIRLPGFTFQPSEIAKGTLVLATAQILSAMQKEDGSGAHPNAMKFVMFLTVPIVLLIAIENLSTACLLFSVIIMMLFIGRVPMLQFGKLIGVLTLCVGIGLGLIIGIGTIENNKMEQQRAEAAKTGDKTVLKGGGVFHRFATWRNRILKHGGGTDVAPENYDINENFQRGHANIAIARSGISGVGPGNSMEREFLPQAFSDFIYAIIIEEMGIIGAFAVVILYIFLLFRVGHIASQCENNFPAFLVLGLSLLLVVQACINMMVAVGIMPITGQPLPLISKGGTSTIINCAYIGAILSVSRSAKKVDGKATPALETSN